MNPVNTDTFHETLKSTLTGWGFSGHIAEYIADFSVLIIILMASIIIYYITKVIINRILRRLVEKSNSKWDDFFI